MLQARLLGKYEIRRDGQLIVLSSRPCQSLLAYLLLNPDKLHRREKLAGQFWSTSPESSARSNLRHVLWRIRKALGPDARLRLDSNDLGVSFHPQPGDQLDVAAFEVSAEKDDSTEMLLLAVSAYGGELLPGFYEDWVVLERERLQAAFERKMGRLLDRLLAEERWNDTLEWGEHWVALGTIPEPAFRALMLAHAGLGNLTGAAAQYHRCVEALAKELGVEPSDETRAVYEQILGRKVESILLKPILSAPTPPAFLKEPEKPMPIFVGREAELVALGRYLDKTLRGQAQVVFVSGEAGSGKTALLQTFIRQSMAAQPELVVGWGICNAFFGQGDPYLPFRDVLNTLAGGIEGLYSSGAICRSQALRMIANFPLVVRVLVEQGMGLTNTFLSSSALAARIATLLPSEPAWRKQIEKQAAWEPASFDEQEKSPLFEQYTQVLRNISGEHPLVILLDDLQWIDPGSVRLLFHLVRRLQKSRILIIGAFRSEDIALDHNGERHLLEPLLNELQASFGKILLDLDQIRDTYGKEFINTYLDSEPNQLDNDFRQELYRRTLGNPLFTIELLRNLQERGEIRPNDKGNWIAAAHLNWNSLPPQLEGIIGERIRRLDTRLQDLLLAASVEGEQFTVQVLEQVHGISDLTILRQLSRQLEKRHRLVKEVGETRVGNQRLVRFQFVHALFQEYLYRQLGAAERTALHLEIAKSLETLYTENIALIAIPLARHYHEAGMKEEEVKYLLLAGDQARSLFAFQEATENYLQALADLKELRATEQAAQTLMKLYLVYNSSFDFQHAQKVLEEGNFLWQQLTERNTKPHLPKIQNPYRLPILKTPVLDPALCDNLFDFEWNKQLFCGLAEWSVDRTIIPMAAENWDVFEAGSRYVFHLRHDMQWSDGEALTAEDFEFAWKRALTPATHSLTANLLYDILGAKDYHQGRAVDPGGVGVTAPDPYTLAVDLEGPCSYFPYILSDPISFAVPRHVIERVGNSWTEPDRFVTSGAYCLECTDQVSGKKISFRRNPRYFGRYKGNIGRVELVFHPDERNMYQSFVAGKLDMVEFLLPQLKEEEWKHFNEIGQLHISPIPFVDAIYFIADQPPFDNPDLRRAFVMATDREKLAREIENPFPAIGGYIPPFLPGHSPDIGLPYNPQEAQQILAKAGYPEGRGFPPVRLLLGIVGLEKGDELVFELLQEMWLQNIGISLQKCWKDSTSSEFISGQDFNLFFTGWFADFPDPASFLQTNYVLDESHWYNSTFEALIDEGRHTLDQSQRVELYHQADRVITEDAGVLPLFYGHVYQLIQPWVRKPTGSSMYSSQWKDVILMPH